MPKVPINELATAQKALENRVPELSFWAETNTGHILRVVGHCVVEGTDEPSVIYKYARRPEVSFARPASDWLGMVVINGESLPSHRPVNRF